MIKVSTLLHVADNSGALLAGCLNVPKLHKRKGAVVGCCITVTVKKNIFKKNIIKKSRIITKSQIVEALIITTVGRVRRSGNFQLQAQANAVILLNQYQLPYGSRLFGYIFREIRQKTKFRKVISLASHIV